MRVVQVNYAFDAALGGARDLLDTYQTLTGWAEALSRAGAGVLTVQRFHSSANVTRSGLPYVFGDIGAMVAATRAFQPDVLHVNGLEHAREGVRLSADSLTPSLQTAVVVQDHGSVAPSGLGALVGRRLLRGVDALLFSTVAQAQPWRDAGLIAPHQRVYDVMEASTTVRALPFETARQQSEVRGDPAVVWIGRLNANKDPLTVLDGFERFAARRAGATLTLLFHADELLEAVRARIAASATLAHRVRLVGAVPHDRVVAFLSAADVFVVGSRREGSGYAVMEALACGATPAVTDIAPFRALLGASQVPPKCQAPASEVPAKCQAPGWQPDVGALWTPGDADACARALAAAAAQRDRRRVIQHFDTHLTWDAVGRRARAVYEDVLRSRPQAAF